MVVLTTGPQWFQGYDIVFNIIFAIITLLIAGLSFKAKALTDEKKYSFFGASFLLIALSYILFVIFALIQNTFIVNLLNKFDFIFLIQMLLILLAYTSLLIIILKIESRRVISLILLLILLFVLFSYQYFIKFHIVSFFLLAFLAIQFYMNYNSNKNVNTKLVFISFFLLACSHIFFATIQISQALYVAGEGLQLLGFILLFLMFIKIVVLQNGRKKRKTGDN